MSDIDIPDKDIPDKQRALVLQGSVALGAFEAGVFKKLYEMIKIKDPNWERRMFDVVAGTSAGAINAAILISHVKENKTWKGSAEKLVEYWRDHLSSPTPPIAKTGVHWWDEHYQWWGKYYDVTSNYSSSNNGSSNSSSRTVASEEAARRYYSTKYFFTYGAPNVFLPAFPFPHPDNKFFDNNPLFLPTNLWLRYSNKPLRNSLEQTDRYGKKFVDYPLTTSFERKEPRFLAVSVDVQHGKAVTFDSYSSKSTFQAYDPDTGEYKDHLIEYDEGIMAEHIMASASFPVYFDYEMVDGRKFWDGGILSNTPLRELLQSHRDYWHKDRKAEKVPDLDVYIVNVWPAIEKNVPIDHDGVKDRKNDITHSDQTEYDQKVALFVSDYYDLANELLDLAKRKGASTTDIDAILSRKANSMKRSGVRRRYSDLMKGRFDLQRVVTIEHKDDPDSISNKWADYTSETINKLIVEGEQFEDKAVVKTMPADLAII
jgi:NTE family protein